MNCKNCYQEIPDGSKFCPHCGAKQNEVQPNAEQENAVKNDPVQATGAAKTTKCNGLPGCIRLSEQRWLSGCSRLSE